MNLETLEGAKRLRATLADRLDVTLLSISTTSDTWRVAMLRANLKELDRMIAGLEADRIAATSH
jgi:hypothetical protein